MDNIYKPIPFWSWNEELDEQELVRQIDWMYDNGIGGFFMHARGGLTTPYLGEKWFSCVEACLKRANELGMEAYAYDENGWPSGFAGGELLKREEDRDCYLTYTFGPCDKNAFASFDMSKEQLVRVTRGDNCLNVYVNTAVSTADILNKDVVRRFLELTHEKYREIDRLGNLRGFFTDEPQYQRWHHAYSRVLEEYFKEQYDEDIKDKIGLMFVEKEGYRDFRYRYWKAMQHLMLNNWAKQVYEWCDNHNYKLTGHYVEEDSLAMQMQCCAGIMPYYEYEHIPGMDLLTRRLGNDYACKQVTSVCAQLGKKQILTESFALVGWDATPEDLKHLADWQFVNGVNLFCYHLLPYSEHGQRKRDYPEHYSKINPWVNEHFKLFNETFASIGERIAKSTELVNVGVLYPIRSCYFNFKREDSFGTIQDIEDGYRDTTNLLGDNHIPYHLIDETLLEKYGSVDGDTLKLGLCSYKYIVLPRLLTMDKSTEKLLKEFINNGGKVLLLYDKPEYLEGFPYSYDYLESNTSIEDILKGQPFNTSFNKNIRIAYREDDITKKRFFFVVNLGIEDTTLNINGYDLLLRGYESRFIEENELKSDVIREKEIVRLSNHYKIVNPVDNYLTLDFIRYSKDGATYSEPIPYMGIQDQLLHERYNGVLYLKYEFDIKEIPSKCSALIEDTHTLLVKVNGQVVEKFGSVLEKDLWEYNIASKLVQGHNEIIVQINYIQKDEVYYALFTPGASETLVNCLAYTTTIEAIYLKGNFGVYGDFTKGKEANVYIANKFSIGEQKKEIDNLITDGFPFFRGKIEVEQEIEVNSNNALLYIPERYQTIDLAINGVFVKTMMFGHYLDISKYVKPGKNIIEMGVVISNRNLLGPFHNVYMEEDLSVGPFTFERFGNWKDGKCPLYRDSYSFVKNLL